MIIEEYKNSDKKIDVLYGKKESYDTKCDILIAGMKKVGVGFNDPRLNLLILASERSDIEQYAGRIRTLNYIIIDIVDKHQILENRWKKRKKWYIEHGGKIRKE